MIFLLTGCILFGGNDGKGGPNGTSSSSSTSSTSSTPSCSSSGFQSEATSWKMPTTELDATEYPWVRTYASTPYQSCSGKDSDWYYMLSDLTGDGIADLVVTHAECDDPSVGKDHWLVYPGNGSGFGEGLEWALPDLGYDVADYPYGMMAADTPYQTCNNKESNWSYTVMDLTGDGFADLVVTRADCKDRTIGQDHWMVYPGDGSGFGKGSAWSLPETALDPDQYPWARTYADTPYQTCKNKESGWYYLLMDMNGDGQPDLVVTRGDCDDSSSGKTRWDVYAGEEGGFGALQKWSLPETKLDASEYPWNRSYADTPYQSCGGKDSGWYFVTRDMNGDRLPDLVLTRAECDDATVGKTRWLVYPGTGKGFGEAEKWSLPETALDASEYPWTRTYADTPYQSCDGKDSEWYFVSSDLTADGIVDLVITRATCDDPSAGKSRWLVYPGNGKGFGEALQWSMPDTALDAGDYPWTRTYADTPYQSCDGKDSAWYYITSDLNGDAAPDLVLTRAECDDDALGKKSWAVYLGDCR